MPPHSPHGGGRSTNEKIQQLLSASHHVLAAILARPTAEIRSHLRFRRATAKAPAPRESWPLASSTVTVELLCPRSALVECPPQPPEQPGHRLWFPVAGLRCDTSVIFHMYCMRLEVSPATRLA